MLDTVNLTARSSTTSSGSQSSDRLWGVGNDMPAVSMRACTSEPNAETVIYGEQQIRRQQQTYFRRLRPAITNSEPNDFSSLSLFGTASIRGSITTSDSSSMKSLLKTNNYQVHQYQDQTQPKWMSPSSSSHSSSTPSSMSLSASPDLPRSTSVSPFSFVDEPSKPSNYQFEDTLKNMIDNIFRDSGWSNHQWSSIDNISVELPEKNSDKCALGEDYQQQQSRPKSPQLLSPPLLSTTHDIPQDVLDLNIDSVIAEGYAFKEPFDLDKWVSVADLEDDPVSPVKRQVPPASNDDTVTTNYRSPLLLKLLINVEHSYADKQGKPKHHRETCQTSCTTPPPPSSPTPATASDEEVDVVSFNSCSDRSPVDDLRELQRREKQRQRRQKLLERRRGTPERSELFYPVVKQELKEENVDWEEKEEENDEWQQTLRNNEEDSLSPLRDNNSIKFGRMKNFGGKYIPWDTEPPAVATPTHLKVSSSRQSKNDDDDDDDDDGDNDADSQHLKVPSLTVSSPKGRRQMRADVVVPPARKRRRRTSTELDADFKPNYVPRKTAGRKPNSAATSTAASRKPTTALACNFGASTSTAATITTNSAASSSSLSTRTCPPVFKTPALPRTRRSRGAAAGVRMSNHTGVSKRLLHNTMEKHRRIELRNHFDKLHEALPDNYLLERMPKNVLLGSATTCIKDLQNKLTELAERHRIEISDKFRDHHKLYLLVEMLSGYSAAYLLGKSYDPEPQLLDGTQPDSIFAWVLPSNRDTEANTVISDYNNNSSNRNNNYQGDGNRWRRRRRRHS